MAQAKGMQSKNSNASEYLMELIQRCKENAKENFQFDQKEASSRPFEIVHMGGYEFVKFHEVEKTQEEQDSKYHECLETAGLLSHKDLNLDNLDNYLFLKVQDATPWRLYTKIRMNKSLVLSGPPGTGKTALALSLVKACYEEDMTIVIKRWYHWLVKMRGVYQDDEIRDMEQFLRPSVKADILLIDELGTDKKNTATPFEQEQLMYIISERHGNSKPTIVTTNLVREEITTIYGEAIYQRLADEERGYWFEFVNEEIKRKLL